MQLVYALFAVMMGIGVCVLYYAGANKLIDKIFSEKNGFLKGKDHWYNAIQPWIFLAPALFFLGVYLVYPVYETLRLSFFNFGGLEFVGLKNYLWAYENPEFQQAVLNNLLWLLFVPILCVVSVSYTHLTLPTNREV